MQWFNAFFCSDVAKMPCSCIGTPIKVGREDTTQVGSLLLVGLGPISNGCTLNTRICVSNSRISVRAIITQFWRSLPGWCSMCKLPPNDNCADSCLVLASKFLLPLAKIFRKC